MAENRYYYLQLMDDIFTSRRIKKMRKIEHGDTMFVIYLKLQLVAMKHDGKLTYTGLEPTLSAELALDIDEKPENVEACLDFLLKTELAEQITENEIFLPWSVKNSRSEGASAERMRKKRAQEKEAKLQPDKVSEQCDGDSEQCAHNVTDNYNYNYSKNQNTEERDSNEDAGNQEAEDNLFTQLWDRYPRKTGDIRTAHIEYLAALETGATSEDIRKALEAQITIWKIQEDRYIPSMENWLRNRAWKNYSATNQEIENRPTSLECDVLPTDA